jgi:hypothetical protein
MKKLFLLPLLLGMLPGISQLPGGETVFRAVNVIPMSEEKVIKEQDVVVQNGRRMPGSLKQKENS